MTFTLPALTKLYRFVILLHQSPTDEHWDVMLETDLALITWAVPPQKIPGLPFVCSTKRLPDHRKHYLDYEGIISGNRGTVSRIDAGTYRLLSPEQYILNGTIFTGTLTVKKITMIFEPYSI